MVNWSLTKKQQQYNSPFNKWCWNNGHLHTKKKKKKEPRPRPYTYHKNSFKIDHRSSSCGTGEMNPTRDHEVAGSIPGLAQWVKDLALPWALLQVTDTAWILHCCGCGVQPAAVALIGPLAWEPPYGVALNKKAKKKKKILNKIK